MQPIPSTAQVLAFKVLNYSVDERWANWAVDMLMAGFDTEHLIELAGISNFYNQFELTALTDKVFAELGLRYTDIKQVIKNYASYIISNGLTQKTELDSILIKLKDLYDYSPQTDILYNFCLLYWAKEDLFIDANQYYWLDADRCNIDSIITNYFTQWLTENPLAFT